jgi:RNA polymerase sigma-70 factor (ECF subfamily)
MYSSFPAARFPALPLSKEKAADTPIYKDTAPPSAEPSDEALIARIRANDVEALGILFDRYARLVWSIARRILRNKEEADDLLQDVFLFVRRMADSFDTSKGTLRGMIVHATYQHAFTRRRYLIRRNFYSTANGEQDLLEQMRAPAKSFYDNGLEAHLGREGLKRVFAELSEEQRETLRLTFVEGYSLEEIAERLGQSYGNVRHHYYRGLEKLRRQFRAVSGIPDAKRRE